MNIHKNARLTPLGRAHLIKEIARIGLTPAAAAAGVSSRTARKWLRRFAAQGPAGVADRSSRPQRSPRRCCAHKRQRIIGLRRNQRLTYAVIAERFTQTLLRKWAYKYRCISSRHRAAELPQWMVHYNFHRPHSATENRPPAPRLGLTLNNVSRIYT